MKRLAAYRRGQRAEALCRFWLRLKGYRIIAQQFRCPAGELDIAARRGAVLAIIEVKARGQFEGAVQAISSRQRRRIVRASETLLQRRPDLATMQIRFDAMLVLPYRLPHHIMDAWRL